MPDPERVPERILIVGGTGGLVEAGVQLLRRGHAVALLGRSAEGITRARARLDREGPGRKGFDAPLLQADANDAAALAGAVADLVRRWGRVTAAVHNVGPGGWPLSRTWDGEAVGAYLGAQARLFGNLVSALLPHWRAVAGHLVFPMGHLAFVPEQAPPVYAAWYGARERLLGRLAGDVPGLTWSYVILGRMGDRWLTHEEIGRGVVRAVEQKPPRVEVGTP